MAQKLHDTYGFSYSNLKVLLGGWNTWKAQNATDPNGYPVETAGGTTPATPGSASNGQSQVGNGVVILTPVQSGAAGPTP